MTEADTAGPPAQARIHAGLQEISQHVAGVHGSLVATCDGFLIAHDLPDLEPMQVAALVATTRGLASSSTLATGRGDFREVVIRGTDGYLAVYAAGDSAVLAVIGTADLNIGMLNLHVRQAAKTIAACAKDFGGWAASASHPTRSPSPKPPEMPSRRTSTRRRTRD